MAVALQPSSVMVMGTVMLTPAPWRQQQSAKGRLSRWNCLHREVAAVLQGACWPRHVVRAIDEDLQGEGMMLVDDARTGPQSVLVWGTSSMLSTTVSFISELSACSETALRSQ